MIRNVELIAAELELAIERRKREAGKLTREVLDLIDARLGLQDEIWFAQSTNAALDVFKAADAGAQVTATIDGITSELEALAAGDQLEAAHDAAADGVARANDAGMYLSAGTTDILRRGDPEFSLESLEPEQRQALEARDAFFADLRRRLEALP